MLNNLLKKNYVKIIIIILLSLIIDNFLLTKINDPPAWDQGFHLTNVFKMYNIIDIKNINIFDKFNLLFNVTDNYRGPLSYFLSAIFLKIFKNSYHYAYLSNQIFNVISIVSIFNLGKLFKNDSVGIWGSIIFTFSSIIINQRTDYLIDLSLTSFCTLNLLFFTKWYLDDKKYSLFSILSGISLGLIFLTKPTGIVLFFLPLLIIIVRLIKFKSLRIHNINEIILFVFSFLFIIFPWFSRHWLTIITSTINAWKWGVSYQEGLESNSWESWVYYFKRIPALFGIINFSIFSIIFIIEKSFKNYNLKIKKINKLNLWFLIYLLNCYLILSLMSTKDIRFVLPLFPLLCIYLSAFINSNEYKLFKNKKTILLVSLSISLFLTHNGINFENFKYSQKYKWPHNEIINEIGNYNANLTSVLAILPDTKEINSFNFSAEASRQGEYVEVRQVISNEETYKEDLKFFDWFLVKTKDQGIMSNLSKDLLNQYLLDNDSFIIHKEWILPDDSKLILLRRNLLNTYLLKTNCKKNSPDLDIKQINNGLNLTISGDGKLLKSSSILLDFVGEEFKGSSNISLANGFFDSDFNEESCYELSQNVSFNFPKNIQKNLLLKARILNKNGSIQNLKLINNYLKPDYELIQNNKINMINRISEVSKLGTFLRKGEYKNLFDLVGILNQSDPKQIYLIDSEKVYLQRFKDNKNLEDLYSLLISQILQRKVLDAEKTIDIILEMDNNNGNAHLAKSIINVYLLDKKDALNSLNNSKIYDKSLESKEISKAIEGLTYLLNMKFIKAYRMFI